MADRLMQTKDAIEAAKANGWEFLSIQSGSIIQMRRMTEHSTPQYAMDNDWWGPTTYTTCEFISFIFTDRNRVPKVTYATHTCPWVGRNDVRISYKTALALLAQPVAESELHDRD